MKALFALIAVSLFTVASAEWTPDMTITSPQSAFDQAWCSQDGQTATVTFGFHLSAQAASAANLTYTQTGGVFVSGPTYVADGIQPDGDWSFTGGKGALKTYDNTFTYTFPGTGTFTVTVCARQPGLDHDNACESHTVILNCPLPAGDKCDKETDVIGEVKGNKELCKGGTINFQFKGSFGAQTTVTVRSDQMMVNGNTWFTVPVDRNGDSCVYNLQWKPGDAIAAGGTVASGAYEFVVGDGTLIDYTATLNCTKPTGGKK